MNPISYLLQRRLKLSPPLTRNLVVQQDLRVPMPDGVELLTNRWAPRTGGDGLPTILIRSPYGRSGHRIRVQVSSGAFPRYARNTGTGEPHATATTLKAADQTVYHNPTRPSAVILPVRWAV